MKFSILLPTRDRLELLKLAIESVRRQDYGGWEIIVSDNASSENLPGYLDSLGDRRIRYRRTDSLVPVTDNWNAALRSSSGDYFIMLGDDDALTRGSLSEASRLIEAWHSPDAIYAQAHQYAYAGVFPGRPKAFLQTGYNAFLEGASQPYRLPGAVALEMVRAAMSFRIRFGFNMQHFVVSRRLAERLAVKGLFFQSPYPDYYAANAILLAAESLVATPQPLAMIGISPRSFGWYYLNDREAEGVEFLRNLAEPAALQALGRIRVPGSNMNDSWLLAMETLKRNFPEVAELAVDYSRYRLLQFHALVRAKGGHGVLEVLRHMRPGEWVVHGATVAAYGLACLVTGGAGRRIRESIRARWNPFPRFDPHLTEVPYRDILEAAMRFGG